MTFSNLLLAIDVNDPELAKAAFEAARSLSGEGVETHILYVRYFLPLDYEGAITVDFDQEETERAREMIEGWKAEYGLSNATFASRRGRVRDEVLDHAQRVGADLIIIGSHQPSLTTKVLGSNAAAIVRNSPVSVLVARRGADV